MCIHIHIMHAYMTKVPPGPRAWLGLGPGSGPGPGPGSGPGPSWARARLGPGSGLGVVLALARNPERNRQVTEKTPGQGVQKGIGKLLEKPWTRNPERNRHVFEKVRSMNRFAIKVDKLIPWGMTATP